MPEGAGNIATATAEETGRELRRHQLRQTRRVRVSNRRERRLRRYQPDLLQAENKLIVTVKPNGAALTAASVLTQVKDDAGEPANKVLKVPGEVMTFTNTYKKPAQGKDVAAEGKPGTSIDGQLVQVGSRLVYTIDWVNDAVDETGKAVAADIIIRDQIPAGTAYVEGSAAPAADFDGEELYVGSR